MYRGIKLYEQGVIKTNGDLKREAVSEALDNISVAQGPGGLKTVPGTGHCAMNMYIAQNKGAIGILFRVLKWCLLRSVHRCKIAELRGFYC